MSEITSHTTEQKRSEEIYRANIAAVKKLDPTYQDFYYDCQAYLYLSTPPSEAVDKELGKLVQRLTLANRQGLTVEAIIGMSGEDYCKLLLRRLKAPKYTFDSIHYSRYIIVYILFTLFLVSLFEAIRGGIYYGDVAAALQMPVAFSLLGIPLQILMLLTMFFFAVQFRIKRSFDATWYSNGNIIYLLALIVTIIAVLFIPFFTRYYGVFIVAVPVWFIWLICLIYGLYLYYSHKFDLSERLFNLISTKEETPVQDQDIAETDTETETTVDENTSIWQTIRLRNPLLTRKSYRKMREKEEKLDNQNQKINDTK